jgi:hypothetical protein
MSYNEQKKIGNKRSNATTFNCKTKFEHKNPASKNMDEDRSDAKNIGDKSIFKDSKKKSVNVP